MSARTLPPGLPRSTRPTSKTSKEFLIVSRGSFKSIAKLSNSAKCSKHGGNPLETHVNLSSMASFELREALLVYSSDRTGGRSDGMSFVTKHSVKVDGKGVPSLLPGSPIGEADIFALIEQIRGAVPSEFLPENVLMRTQETIVWWTPSTIRPMFYVKDKGVELTQLSGNRFPQPALVFRARPGSLDIRALAANERPTPETPMFLAPYWNVSNNGSVCLGTTKRSEE